MKRMRVLVVVHEDLVPPDSLEGYSESEALRFRTEYDVIAGLRRLGHDVRVVGVADDVLPIREAVREWKPRVVFNLLIELRDIGAFQVHVASYLELLGVRYTGCNPRGLLLARDKALSKKIMRYHRIPTPAFAVFRRGRRVRRPAGLTFPLIVKSQEEDASFGLSQASIVTSDEELEERVRFVHKHVETDALAEEYIRGRELTIGVIGNQRLETLPIFEMRFEKLPEGSEPIATARVKWDLEYQERIGIKTGPAYRLPDGMPERIAHIARRVYRALELSGFARIDLRLSEERSIHVIEANPNPDIKESEDFANSAYVAGFDYGALLQRILSLALRYRPPWSSV